MSYERAGLGAGRYGAGVRETRGPGPMGAEASWATAAGQAGRGHSTYTHHGLKSEFSSNS